MKEYQFAVIDSDTQGCSWNWLLGATTKINVHANEGWQIHTIWIKAPGYLLLLERDRDRS